MDAAERLASARAEYQEATAAYGQWARIEGLRRAARDGGDWSTVAVCERALHGGRLDLLAYPEMSAADMAPALAMSPEQARAWCAATLDALDATAREYAGKLAAALSESTPTLNALRRARPIGAP